MTIEQRRGLHRAIAKRLELQHADDLTPVLGLLAHHWRQTGEAETAVCVSRARRRTGVQCRGKRGDDPSGRRGGCADARTCPADRGSPARPVALVARVRARACGPHAGRQCGPARRAVVARPADSIDEGRGRDRIDHRPGASGLSPDRGRAGSDRASARRGAAGSQLVSPLHGGAVEPPGAPLVPGSRGAMPERVGIGGHLAGDRHRLRQCRLLGRPARSQPACGAVLRARPLDGRGQRAGGCRGVLLPVARHLRSVGWIVGRGRAFDIGQGSSPTAAPATRAGSRPG